MSGHTSMVVAAARALNSRAAEQCNVDPEDQWKVYGEAFLQDAEAALTAAAAPELLKALQGMLEIYGVREWHLRADSTVCRSEVECCDQARAAVAKATGGAA